MSTVQNANIGRMTSQQKRSNFGSAEQEHVKFVRAFQTLSVHLIKQPK